MGLGAGDGAAEDTGEGADGRESELWVRGLDGRVVSIRNFLNLVTGLWLGERVGLFSGNMGGPGCDMEVGDPGKGSLGVPRTVLVTSLQG